MKGERDIKGEKENEAYEGLSYATYLTIDLAAIALGVSPLIRSLTLNSNTGIRGQNPSNTKSLLPHRKMAEEFQ